MPELVFNAGNILYVSCRYRIQIFRFRW